MIEREPAGVVVKLAPFSEAVLQHFIYLERPMGSGEPDGKGFAPERLFARGTTGTRLTPMGINYATLGEFYGVIGEGLRDLVQRSDESAPPVNLAPIREAGPYAVRGALSAISPYRGNPSTTRSGVG
jgi:hypothetical protein